MCFVPVLLTTPLHRSLSALFATRTHLLSPYFPGLYCTLLSLLRFTKLHNIPHRGSCCSSPLVATSHPYRPLQPSKPNLPQTTHIISRPPPQRHNTYQQAQEQPSTPALPRSTLENTSLLLSRSRGTRKIATTSEIRLVLASYRRHYLRSPLLYTPQLYRDHLRRHL